MDIHIKGLALATTSLAVKKLGTARLKASLKYAMAFHLYVAFFVYLAISIHLTLFLNVLHCHICKASPMRAKEGQMKCVPRCILKNIILILGKKFISSAAGMVGARPVLNTSS